MANKPLIFIEKLRWEEAMKKKLKRRGIQIDAQDILIYLYKEYTENSIIPSREEICETTKWEIPRIKRALQYLIDKNFIKVTLIPGGLPILRGITADGIDTIEDKKKFKKSFGHSINLGFYTYNWEVSED